MVELYTSRTQTATLWKSCRTFSVFNQIQTAERQEPELGQTMPSEGERVTGGTERTYLSRDIPRMFQITEKLTKRVAPDETGLEK